MTHPTFLEPPSNDALSSLLRGSGAAPDPLFRLPATAAAPLLDRRQAPQALPILAPATQTRRKIWDFDGNLHCSIIGTCLTTSELRQILGKAGYADMSSATEHEVHATGVRAASKPREGAKQLHKALDRRHRLAIARFDKAKELDEVRRLWRDALEQGEIPGAYWAALTHPAANTALVKEAFADVHMLSHLVGAANRADIRRLRQLEQENAELRAKIERQERQLRDAIVSRDTTIRELTRALEAGIVRDGAADEAAATEDAGWEALASDLKHRLARSESRQQRIERQLADTRTALATERDSRSAAEGRETELRQEIEIIEAGFADSGNAAATVGEPTAMLGLTVLYVGGKQSRIGHLRALADRCGAVFLHHDGGLEERERLLPGLVSRADAVLFPVDCISHAAMSLVKRLCRQANKPFLPLRSAGLAPFSAALANPVLSAVRAG
jgi:hypothetical protein